MSSMADDRALFSLSLPAELAAVDPSLLALQRCLQLAPPTASAYSRRGTSPRRARSVPRGDGGALTGVRGSPEHHLARR